MSQSCKMIDGYIQRGRKEVKTKFYNTNVYSLFGLFCDFCSFKRKYLFSVNANIGDLTKGPNRHCFCFCFFEKGHKPKRFETTVLIFNSTVYFIMCF